MTDTSPREFKVVILEKEILREHNLKNVIIHCQNIPQLEITLNENQSSDIIFVCIDDKLIEVAPLLSNNPNINTVYIRTDLMDIWWPIEFQVIEFQCIQISKNQTELLRCLHLKVMLCYFQQGKIYQMNGNHGLANLCFLDAIQTLEQTKKLC